MLIQLALRHPFNIALKNNNIIVTKITKGRANGLLHLSNMKYSLILLALFFLHIPTVSAGWFSPDNYWECLLDEMQQVQSDTIAKEVVDSCKDRYPFHERLFIEKKRSWFGPKTASACVLKYGKRVQSEVGARYIQSACYKLYPLDK